MFLRMKFKLVCRSFKVLGIWTHQPTSPAPLLHQALRSKQFPSTHHTNSDLSALKMWSESRSVVSLTLCHPMDYTVHGILQARILEWVAFPFSRGSSQPRDRTQVDSLLAEPQEKPTKVDLYLNPLPIPSIPSSSPFSTLLKRHLLCENSLDIPRTRRLLALLRPAVACTLPLVQSLSSRMALSVYRTVSHRELTESRDYASPGTEPA